MIFMKIMKITIQIKKWKILIVFDDMLLTCLGIKTLIQYSPLIVNELFVRGSKLNIIISLNIIALFQNILDYIQHPTLF